MRRLREDHLQLNPEIDEVKSIKLSKALQKAYDIICDDQRKARRRKRTETRISGSQGSNDDDDGHDDGEEGSGRGTLRASLPAGFDTLKRILLVDPARIKKKYGRIPSLKVAIAIKICQTILDKDQHLPVTAIGTNATGGRVPHRGTEHHRRRIDLAPDAKATADGGDGQDVVLQSHTTPP